MQLFFRFAHPPFGFLLCVLSCLAYEAIRIKGWYNRFPSDWNKDWNAAFIEYAFDKWDPINLIVYAAILLPFFVVLCNRRRVKTRRAFYVFALLMLAIMAYNYPGAKVGRYGSTANLFMLFYIIVVPLPALAFILIGSVARVNEDEFPNDDEFPDE